MSLIDNHLPEFNKAIEHYQTDIATLKTGRANPAMLDGLFVEAYGAKTPLNQLASINVPEARSIIIQPWDKNVIALIEKSIRDSNLGLSPVNEGEKIRITLPLMTEESRKEIVKKLGQKTEAARIVIRNIRDEVKEAILLAEKNKEFGEDERYVLIEELDKKTADFNARIKLIEEEKETEIMAV